MVLALSLLVAGCVELKPADNQQQTPPEEKGQVKIEITAPEPTLPEPPKVEVKTCKTWAMDLMPETVNVYEGVDSCERKLESTWGDGTPVKLLGNNLQFTKTYNKRFKVEPGTVVGESPDMYYFKSYNGDYVTLGYTKEIVEGGILVGKNEFEVKVGAFDRVDSSKTDGEGVDCFYYDYKIVDPEVISCSNEDYLV